MSKIKHSFSLFVSILRNIYERDWYTPYSKRPKKWRCGWRWRQRYAKGGVLHGGVDYKSQDGELIIPLKQMRRVAGLMVIKKGERMSDLIRRADAIEALDRIGSLDTEDDREYAKGIFDNIPPFTPTERTGEWISLFDGNEWFVMCSKCKTQHYEEDLLMGGSELPNFCPNCGAKNKGGTENE